MYYLDHFTKKTAWKNPLLQKGFFEGEAGKDLPGGWERVIDPFSSRLLLNTLTLPTLLLHVVFLNLFELTVAPQLMGSEL